MNNVTRGGLLHNLFVLLLVVGLILLVLSLFNVLAVLVPSIIIACIGAAGLFLFGANGSARYW